MVSRKWTCQLSRGFTFPIAAAAPPSAITVCALPNSDLQMIAVRMPCSRAAIAARSPAPPAPITSTSYSCRSTVSSLISRAGVIAILLADDPQAGDPAGGHGQDVEVRHHQGAESGPGQLHVLPVELGHETPGAVADRVLGEVPQPATDDVPAGVAGHRVGPEQDHVDPQDVRVEPASDPTRRMEREDRVDGVHDRQQHRGVEEVAVAVLQDPWHPRLALV